MGTVLMRQASSFLQEKYKAARLAFTDVSEAKLWTEKVTSNNVWSPDTKTMTQIAEALHDFDDYWRIVDVLHKRLQDVDWKKWRQSYNSLILLEFLITHGPEDFALEFKCDVEVIKELGTFQYIDTRGINWGMYMKKKTKSILVLMQGGIILQEVRSKAIKLTNGIQGFGSSSPTSLSSSTSPSSSFRSSFGSSSPWSHSWDDMNEPSKFEDKAKQSLEHDFNTHYKGDLIQQQTSKNPSNCGVIVDDTLDWKLAQETFSDINLHDDYEDNNKGFLYNICSKTTGYSPLKTHVGNAVSRSFSDIEREKMKILDRQYSMGY